MPGIAANADLTPDKVAVIDAATGASLTWRELLGRARATARGWDLAPGGRVAVMLPNGLDLAVAQVATAMAQTQIVPINWHLKASEVAYVVEDSGASLVVTDDTLAEHAPYGVAVSLGVSREIGDPLPGEWSTFSPVFYTSGTTGRPKGVVHGTFDPAASEFTQQMLAQMWNLTAADVYLLAAPGYHAGPVGYSNTLLFVGGTVVSMPRWDAALAWELLSERGITATFLTPAHMIRMLEIAEHPQPRALRLVIQGGSPCPVDTKRRFLDALPGVNVSEMYGASEGGATKITSEEWLRKPGSVGQPWPGVSIEIRGSDGETLLPEETGVVWIKPATPAKFHYHNDESKTADTWDDAFFTVGDIGHLDADGFLFLTDRLSDLVIWSGVNISPREIEDALFSYPGVIDCAVLGVPHARDGERLLAMVEAPGVSEEQLTSHLRETLADFKIPHHWEFVTTLPRDPNGKVVKRYLREHWLGANA